MKRSVARVAEQWLERLGRAPAWAWLALASLLFATGLFIMHSLRGYTSDDVVLQTMLAEWLRGYHHTAYIGTDNFFIKLPYYIIAEYLLPHSRATLFATVAVFALANLALFWYSARYFVGRCVKHGHTALGLLTIWVVTASSTFLVMFMVPNLRNLEVGLSFFILMLMARYAEGEFEFEGAKGRALTALALVGLGFFIYNDPYFLYVLLAPLILLLGLSAWRHRDDLKVWLLVFVLLAVIMYKLWSLTLLIFHIKAFTLTASFASIDGALHNLRLYFEVILNLFHANFFNATPTSPTAVLAFVNLCLLGFIVRCLWGLRRTANLQRDFWKIFFVLQIIITSALFIFSNYPSDLQSGRYLVVIPFDIVILGALFFSEASGRIRPVLTVLLTLAILGNMGSLALQYRNGSKAGNTENYLILGHLEGLGLTKGYAPYLDGNINTYLSGNKIDVIPIDCYDNSYTPRPWLFDDGILFKPASRSFFIYRANAVLTSYCDSFAAPNQFGAPAQTIGIDANTSIFVYDYDITAKLKPIVEPAP